MILAGIIGYLTIGLVIVGIVVVGNRNVKRKPK